MSQPRFVVRSVTGYTAKGVGGTAKPTTSYTVLDTFYNYRVVRNFPVTSHSRSDFVRRSLANEAAAQLNAEYDGITYERAT